MILFYFSDLLPVCISVFSGDFITWLYCSLLALQGRYRLGGGAEGWFALYVRNKLVCFSRFCDGTWGRSIQMVSELLGKVVVQATIKNSERKPDWAKALALQEQITNICANWEQRALSG